MSKGKASIHIRKRLTQPVEIGWCELIDLPKLGMFDLHAKIDTGAATSSLHAVNIKKVMRGAEPWVVFTVPRSPEHGPHRCEARLIARKLIKSSNGRSEYRYVIETAMKMGPLTWTGHMTLANRQSMAFPVLVGRRALRRGFVVNSARRWTFGQPEVAATEGEE
jgi:hypothetical protein